MINGRLVDPAWFADVKVREREPLGGRVWRYLIAENDGDREWRMVFVGKQAEKALKGGWTL